MSLGARTVEHMNEEIVLHCTGAGDFMIESQINTFEGKRRMTIQPNPFELLIQNVTLNS